MQAPGRPQHGVDEGNWEGWLLFAAVLLGIAGTLQTISGLTALFNDGYLLVPARSLVVDLDYSTWGWVHIAVGSLLNLAAASLVGGHLFGQVAGVVFAALSMITNISYLAAYPVWSVVTITLDILVIYAIVVHGRAIAD
jgi:hypothetical protein